MQDQPPAHGKPRAGTKSTGMSPDAAFPLTHPQTLFLPGLLHKLKEKLCHKYINTTFLLLKNDISSLWELPDDVKNPLGFWKEKKIEKKKKKEPRLGATDLKNAFCVVPSFIYFSSTDFPDTSTEKPRHHLDAPASARLNFRSLGTCQQ